jgi:hypothetical protein
MPLLATSDPQPIIGDIVSLERDIFQLNQHYKRLLQSQSELLSSGVHDMQQVNIHLRKTAELLEAKSEVLF